MGGACCTCSEEKKYRFKGFVVSVYPSNAKDGPDEEALGKLISYVASNPERIPRVCRKISKLTQIHLQRRRVERVMVSVKMLRSLIEHATAVNGFVPHSIEICAQLLATNEVWYTVGAADVLCALCNRLSQDPETEPSRRLIADNKDRLLPPLHAMCTVQPRSAGAALAFIPQCRYAAVVAIGQLARCLHGALAGDTASLFFPIAANLLAVLKGREGQPVDAGATAESLLLASAAGALGPSSSSSPSSDASGFAAVVPTSAELPSDETDPDLAYARACVFAVGATAGCVTAADVEPLTQQLIAFLGESGGWRTPLGPVVIFKALISAMRERPQGLGFTVFQCLCAAGSVNADPVVRIGILRSLDACVATLPMSGDRPQFILDYLRTAILAAPVDVKDGNTKPTLNAIVAVTASLLRSIYAQRNTPQLQSVLTMLVRLLSDCVTSAVEPNASEEEEEEEGGGGRGKATTTQRRGRRPRGPPTSAGNRTYLALRCTAAAAAYVRTTPLIDRQNGALDVCGVIEPFLVGGNDAHRTWAARILRGILAGVPSAAVEANAPAVLNTEEYDVAFAEEWAKTVMVDTTTVTPRCVVEVGSVLTAIMAGYGINALPFVLTTLWSLQNRCVRGGSVAYDPNSSNVVTSSVPSSPLTRAWLHLIPVVLASCGKVYDVPKLTEYAQEILSRRQAAKPSELATCFEPTLKESSRPELRFTVCGLCVSSADGARKDAPLSSHATLKPVTKLPSFSYIANILVDADRSDTVAVFGATSANDLKTAIERVCFSAVSEASVSLDRSSIPSQSGGGNHPSELRNGGSGFALCATPPQLLAARQMRVSLVDRAPSAIAANAEDGNDNDDDGPLAGLRNGGNGSHADRVGEVLSKLGVGASTRLLPPDAKVSSSLPLFAVDADAQEKLAVRGRPHDRQVAYSRDTHISRSPPRAAQREEEVNTEGKPTRDEGPSTADTATGSEAIQASAALANEDERGKVNGGPEAAPKAGKKTREGGGGVRVGVADVPTEKQWFATLQSSYVDLE